MGFYQERNLGELPRTDIWPPKAAKQVGEHKRKYAQQLAIVRSWPDSLDRSYDRTALIAVLEERDALAAFKTRALEIIAGLLMEMRLLDQKTNDEYIPANAFLEEHVRAEEKAHG